MDLNSLETYLSVVTPGLSSLIGHELKGEREQELFRLYTDDVDILVDTDHICVLRLPEDQLDLTGDYSYTDNFDFIRVFAEMLDLVFSVGISEVYDICTFKQTGNWRDFVSRISGVFEIETELTENGIYLQGIGEFREEDCTLYLEAIDLFEYAWKPEPGEIFKEGVLSLLSTVFPSEEFMELMLGSLGAGGDDMSGEEGGGEEGEEEGGDVNIDIGGGGGEGFGGAAEDLAAGGGEDEVLV